MTTCEKYFSTSVQGKGYFPIIAMRTVVIFIAGE